MRRLLIPVLAASLLLSGCAFLKNLFSSAFRAPTLTFRRASLANASLSSATVDLVYAIENPNPLGLSLAEVDYALTIEGKQVVAGKPPTGLQIPARNSAELVFPANVRFADIAPVIQTFLNKDFAHYRAEGHIGLSTPLGVIRFPLSHEDQFEVPKLPSVSFAAPQVTNLNFQGATVTFPLMVTNRNSYPLPINGLSGAVMIAGANVGNLSTGDLGALAGKGTRQLNLPLTIHFASAAAAAMALRSGSGTVAFSGNVQSGGASLPMSFSQALNFSR